MAKHSIFFSLRNIFVFQKGTNDMVEIDVHVLTQVH